MKTVMKGVYLITALSLSIVTCYADTTDPQNDLNATTPNSSSSPTTNTPTTGEPATDTTSSSTTNTNNSETANPIGNYQCQQVGSNATSSYSLSVAKAGDTYTFEWADSKGESAYYGTGVMVSSLPNAISVSFWDPKKPDMIGIEVFELKADGSLAGNWTLQSDNRVGAETCTKNKSTS